MSKFGSYTYKDVATKLKKLWCTYVKNINGTHEKWVNKDWDMFTVIHHKNENMRKWTSKLMLKLSKISNKDFENA